MIKIVTAEEEKLKKFLASDDPEMVRMGIALVKGSEVISKEILEMMLGFYMFHDDSGVRGVAKSIVRKFIPNINIILKKRWQAEYRTQSWIWEIGWMEKMISELKEAGIKPIYLLREAQTHWEAKTPDNWADAYSKKENVLSKIRSL